MWDVLEIIEMRDIELSLCLCPSGRLFRVAAVFSHHRVDFFVDAVPPWPPTALANRPSQPPYPQGMDAHEAREGKRTTTLGNEIAPHRGGRGAAN